MNLYIVFLISLRIPISFIFFCPERNSNFETASVVFSFIGKFGITGSFSTIFLWTPELYPTNLRYVDYNNNYMNISFNKLTFVWKALYTVEETYFCVYITCYQFCHIGRVPPVEQELAALPESLRSLPVMNGVHFAQSLFFCGVLTIMWPFWLCWIASERSTYMYCKYYNIKRRNYFQNESI